MAAENEVHLTCLQCSTVYRLDPVHLGSGRMVRCSSCKKEWYQGAPEGGVLPAPLDAPPPPPPEIETIPVLPPDWDHSPAEDLTINPVAKDEFSLGDDMRVLPESVMPEKPASKSGVLMPPIMHKPLGMSAQAFGAAVFMLFFCVSFSTLLVFRTSIVSHYPPMLSLYKAVGVRVDAPGQGLSFSVMTAETRIEKDVRSLAIAVKLSNISDHDAPYPYYRVAVRDATGSVVQKWDFVPEKKTINSGESVPITMTFRDAPENAKTAEVIVTAD